MIRLMRVIRHIGEFISTMLALFGDGGRYRVLRLRSPNALAAENLFPRTQLALYHGTPDPAHPGVTHSRRPSISGPCPSRHLLRVPLCDAVALLRCPTLGSPCRRSWATVAEAPR